MGYLAVDHCPSKVLKKGGRGPGCICVRWWWNLTLPGARPPALGASVIAQRDPCYRLEIEAVMIGDADALSLLMSAGRHVDK